MSFGNIVVWILIVYAVYYGILFLYDYFFHDRSVKDVTGVQLITVEKPADVPIQVYQEEDNIPKPVFGNSQTTIFDEKNDSGQSGITEKKKMTNNSRVQTLIKIDDMNIDMNKEGQQMDIQFFMQKFMEAQQEFSDVRLGVANLRF